MISYSFIIFYRSSKYYNWLKLLCFQLKRPPFYTNTSNVLIKIDKTVRKFLGSAFNMTRLRPIWKLIYIFYFKINHDEMKTKGRSFRKYIFKMIFITRLRDINQCSELFKRLSYNKLYKYNCTISYISIIKAIDIK